MNRTMLITSAFVALISAPALAQTSPAPPNSPTVPSVPNPGSANPANPGTQRIVPPSDTTGSIRNSLSSADDLLGDKIQGLSVYSTKAVARASNVTPVTGSATVTKDQYQQLRDSYQSIGKIDDIVVSPEGQVRTALVSVGGFLGVGNRNVAVSWNEVRFIRTNDGDVLALVDKSKADLEQMPEYKAARR